MDVTTAKCMSLIQMMMMYDENVQICMSIQSRYMSEKKSASLLLLL